METTKAFPIPSVALALRQMLPTRPQTLLLRAALDSEQGAQAWATWRAEHNLPTTLANDQAGLKGLLPLLAYALARNGASVGADDLSLLRMARYRESLRTERFQAIQHDALATLTTGGLSPLLLKGAALAATVYPHAELRHSHDIDLLIRPHDLPLATNLLLAYGYRYPPATGQATELTPEQFSRCHDQALTRGDLTLNHASGLPVALHTKLFRNDAFALPLEGAWQNARHLDDNLPLEEAPVRMLAPAWELIHILGTMLCVPKRARVTWVCDAHFLIAANPTMDWVRFCELATESNLALATYLMLEYLQQQQASPIPPFVFEQLQQKFSTSHSTHDEQFLQCARNQNAVTYGELFAAATTWQERAWLLRWMILPP